MSQNRTHFKTTNIKGKDYVEVNTRVQYFREHPDYEGWSMITKIIELSEKRAVFQAVITDSNDRIRATGLAYEDANSTYINKTSYVENCETSAWGRALGNLGIGISTSIASKEEVENAIENQKPTAPAKPKPSLNLGAKYDHSIQGHKQFLLGVFNKVGIKDREEMKRLAEIIESSGAVLNDIEARITDLKKLEVSEG